MSDLERVHAAKREFNNKINYVDYDDYDSNSLAGVKYRIIGMNFEHKTATKVQNMLEELIGSLDDVQSLSSKDEWESVIKYHTYALIVLKIL